LRNRNVVFALVSVIGLLAGLAFNVYFQIVSRKLMDPAWMAAHLAGADSLVGRMAAAWPPAWLAWKALTAKGAVGVLYALANVALGLAASALVAGAFGPLYARSLPAFTEERVKRSRLSVGRYERTFRQRPVLLSLFQREVRLMNREPVYFINGPLVILIMPIIGAIGVLAIKLNPQAVQSLAPVLAQARDSAWAPLACAAFGAFSGSSTSIACTALSRDAKALRYLRALPVGWRDLMLAKFFHALAFAAFGALVCSVGPAILLGLSVMDTLAAFALALAFSAFACVAGLWLDTAHPRLSWDNPIAALKQNPNATIFILAVMATLGGLGAVCAVWPLGKVGLYCLFLFGFTGLTVALAALYPRFARQALAAIEV
jgi:ABC-2 type transport system permease protein